MNGAKKDTIEKAFAKRIADIPTVSATMDVYKSTLGVLKACTAEDVVQFERLTLGRQVLISTRDLYDKELAFDAHPSAQLRATHRFMYHQRARLAAERWDRKGEKAKVDRANMKPKASKREETARKTSQKG